MTIHREDALKINQMAWDNQAPGYGGTSLPAYGPMAPAEDELGLFGEIRDKRVLELGCGSGQSLLYMARNGAAELWGYDLSPVQIEMASKRLAENGLKANLFACPMDADPGLPRDYFDIIYSIYALGWTVDLDRTLSLVAQWLKPGGKFIFSWEHPVFSCLEYRDGAGWLAKPYNAEGPREAHWRGESVVMFHRKTGTFINALAAAGLSIARVVEESRIDEARDSARTSTWYSVPRARLVPTTLIVSAVKG